MIANFPTLPLDGQLGALHHALAQGEPLLPLLDLCAPLPDSTPLAWLCAQPGVLRENADVLAHHLLTWPETSLLKVLKQWPAEPALERLLRIALELVPLERLAVMAILDRTLKHQFPERYEAYLDELDPATERGLALLPARRSPPATPARQKLALRAIEQLAQIPKAASLSHAEELLSRCVYTQPGHFLFELLQNAEDCQARTFQARFRPDRVEIWHDGLPFDLRDLIGVTSIGQTTKRKQQIGFFGVGFKSVYEVTDRPQIYSDVYCFEIIDVSVPRALERPASVRSDGTTLILPLKKPFPGIHPLDPCLLLSLTHLRRIELDDFIMERQGDQVNGQAFLLDESRHLYPDRRESGRPESTPLLVALYLDGNGHPVPPPADAPTVYSYLPTAQISGLRFLLHAHFDLPVDRERIHPESQWNHWILEQVPAAVARLAARADLLDVLPLPGEPQGPFAALPEAIGAALRGQPCVNGRRPGEIWLTSPEIASLPLPLPLWAPTERARAVAVQTLGCPTFGIPELLGHLQAHPLSSHFDELFALLLPHVEEHRETLLALPIVPDATGRLCRPDQLALAEAALQPLFAPERLVSAEVSPVFVQCLGCRMLTPNDILSEGRPLEHPDLALEQLARASPEVRHQARRLPLFLTRDGRRLPLAQDDKDWQGAVAASHPDLAELYAGRRPLLADACSDWRPLELDWGMLVADLREGRLSELPHELLKTGYMELTESQKSELAELPLWPDRPLRGALRPAYPELRGLLPDLPFLPEELCLLPHVQAMLPQAVGADVLLESLTQPSDRGREPALEFLIAHAQELHIPPTFFQRTWLLDDRGRQTAALHLYRPESQELRHLYRPPLTRRSFPSELSERLLGSLDLWHRLPLAGASELLEDVWQVRLDDEHALELLEYLRRQGPRLTRAEAQQWLKQPILAGKSLGGPDLTHVSSHAWMVEEGLEDYFRHQGWTLVSEAARPAVRALLLAAGREPVGPRELLAAYRGVQPAPPSLELLRLLAARPDRLAGIPDLLDLELWPTPGGGAVSARQVVDPEPLGGILEPPLTPEAWELFRALDPIFRPVPVALYLHDRIRAEARDRQSLSAQPTWLNEVEKVARVAQLTDAPLCVDGNGHLRLSRLPFCDPHALALHPRPGDVSVLNLPGLSPLPPHQLLGALARADERVYAYLQEHEAEVFSSREARQILTDRPLWLTRGGRLLSARELVLDARIPDLGVDWNPHPEIPTQVCELLRRHLGVGTPQPEALLEAHLLPAYRRQPDPALFAYLRESWPDGHPALDSSFPVEDRRGRHRPASQLLAPDPELDWDLLCPDLLVSERYTSADLRFLRRIGLPELPPNSSIETLFSGPRRQATALALARLAAWLYRRGGPAFLEKIPGFRGQSWLPDALGAPVRPSQLFLPGPDVEALIGSHGRLYPAPEVAGILGDALLQHLGLKGVPQVELDDVLSHLRASSAEGRSLSFRVYQWLEQGNFADLPRRLGNAAWIYTDDGLWFQHQRVLGVHAFTLFGDRRGYWERGASSCPRLCRLFGIPTEVTPEVVRQFLLEIAEQARRQGDQALLRKEKALPRMLLACYPHVVGAGLARNLPLVLTRDKRLVPADHPGLVRSDTPSLERLFAASTLHVAHPGPAEHQEEIERFHAAMGIRSLREAYTVTFDRAGQDCSDECAEGIIRLRGCLRSLLAVVPRIRRQREALSARDWVEEKRLKPLAQSGRIRAIRGLKLIYQLAGVGEARVDAPAAFQEGELWVDRSLVGHPDAPLTGLAQGLVACLYVGHGEEQLVDILEILLPLNTADRMNAYLDARHFPAGPGGAREPADRLQERLSEILDYGLDRRLQARFPALGELESWRDAGLLEGCETPTEAVERLLRHVEEPSQEMREAVQELLEAKTLNRPRPLPAAPLPRPRPVPVEEAAEVAEPGLLTRLVNWVAPKVQQAFARSLARLSDHPYRPTNHLDPQFHGSRRTLEALSMQAAGCGLHHQPAVLPRPYAYAVHLLCGNFDSVTQRWHPVEPGQLAGFHPGQPTGRTVRFQGTLSSGWNRLPLPLYSRLQGNLQLDGGGEVTVGLAGEVRVHCRGNRAVRFEVELLAPPRLSEEALPALPAAWLRPTHHDFPPEVQDFLARTAGRPAWERALAVQEFVQVRYAYDADYLDSPAAQVVLEHREQLSGNHHLALLHARGGAYLGHGICYELNVLVCELCRHLQVPCLLASGWILDEGWVDRPDHIFALAVLPSPHGPCLMPLDGANSVEGPLRPLGRRRPPAGNLAPAPGIPAPPGAWNAPGTLRPVAGLGRVRATESQLQRQELAWHISAVRLVLAVQGGELGFDPQTVPEEHRLARLAEVLRARLGSAELAATLVRVVAGEYGGLDSLPVAVQELERRGLVRIDSIPVLRVSPARP